MKHIQKFDSYQEVNEGWKENILATAMLIGSYFAGSAQTKPGDSISKDSTGKETRTYRVQDSSYINKFLSEGWKLKDVEVDTIWNVIKQKAPKTQVVVTRLKYDKNEFFQSGKFWSLTDKFKADIDSVINKLSQDKDILAKIDITSSTDKQGISPNLKEVLTKLGYTPDNQGLSKARSNSVKTFLTEKGVSDTIINVKNLYEQGEKEIDAESRYVYVDFFYLEKVENPGTTTQKVVKDIKKTYVMQKDITHPGDYKPEKEKVKFRIPPIHLGPIFKHDNRGSLKCPSN